MAVIKAVSSKASLNTAIKYVSQDEKTEEYLKSGINCSPDTALVEMEVTKLAWNKTKGRQYIHVVQSFAPEETTPEQAHKIGVELAEQFPLWKDFQVLVVTHKDRDHIHNHFVVNSVSLMDGHKYQQSKQDLENIKSLSDDLCNKYNLSVIRRPRRQIEEEKNKNDVVFSPRTAKNVVAYSKDTYKILKAAETENTASYVHDIAVAIVEAKMTATSQDDFIKQMESRGIAVDWQENHKYITFTDLERQENGEKKCKIRNSTLIKYYNLDFSKEGLENEFARNRGKAEGQEEDRRTGNEAERSNPGIGNLQTQLEAQNSRIRKLQESVEQVERSRDANKQTFQDPSRRSGRTESAETRESTLPANDSRERRNHKQDEIPDFDAGRCGKAIERVETEIVKAESTRSRSGGNEPAETTKSASEEKQPGSAEHNRQRVEELEKQRHEAVRGTGRRIEQQHSGTIAGIGDSQRGIEDGIKRAKTENDRNHNLIQRFIDRIRGLRARLREYREHQLNHVFRRKGR